MLELLHIENLAVIETADIQFYPGFNALTGETGAGKSIVVDAMQAVLGPPTCPASATTTCRPRSCSSSAVRMPVIPPPITEEAMASISMLTAWRGYPESMMRE